MTGCCDPLRTRADGGAAPRLRALLCALALAGSTACGGARGTPGVLQRSAPPSPVPGGAVPSTILGLRAASEDVSSQYRRVADRAFVTSLRMWSVREGKRLRATVEVARFAPDARPNDPDFQKQMVSQLGKSVPRLRRIGRQQVYITAGNSQTLFIWFRSSSFVLLSVSTDFAHPRALLREAIRTVKP